MAVPHLSSKLHTPALGLLTLLVWAVAAGSGTLWALRLSGSGDAGDVAPPATLVSTPPVDTTLVAKALGAWGAPTSPKAPALPANASRFTLQGVILGADGQGVAVISTDGKPAKAVRVGSKLDQGVVLSAVHARSAELTGDAGPSFTLELPKPGMPSGR